MSSSSPGATDGEDRSVLGRPAREPDLHWAYGEHDDHVADVYLPTAAAEDAPLIVLVHGGFWRPEYDRTHLRPLAAALADLGVPVVSLEYRRRPGEPDLTLADLQSALSHVGDQAWAAGRQLMLVGHSAGGHLVLLLASSGAPNLVRCVALAPVADLAAAQALALDIDAVLAFVGAPSAERPDLDPLRTSTPAIPVLVLHGEADSLVPVELGRRYATVHASTTRLVELPETGHFELIDPESAAFPELLAALGLAGIE